MRSGEKQKFLAYFKLPKEEKVIKELRIVSVFCVLALVSGVVMASGRTFRLPVDICKAKPELEKCKKK